MPVSAGASAVADKFSILTNFFGTKRSTFKDNRFWQTTDSGGTTQYSTIGPEQNEVFTTYTFEEGTHHIRFLRFVSPDILLVHQSKVAGFYRVVSSGKSVEPYAREIKDQLLKDTNMRIRSRVSIHATASGATASPVVSGSSGY